MKNILAKKSYVYLSSKLITSVALDDYAIQIKHCHLTATLVSFLPSKTLQASSLALCAI